MTRTIAGRAEGARQKALNPAFLLQALARRGVLERKPLIIESFELLLTGTPAYKAAYDGVSATIVNRTVILEARTDKELNATLAEKAKIFMRDSTHAKEARRRSGLKMRNGVITLTYFEVDVKNGELKHYAKLADHLLEALAKALRQA